MPTAGRKGTHDIIMNIGSVDYGFMLASDEKGAKIWDVYDSLAVAPRFTTTQAGYESIEREEARLQTDWRGGFGHRFYRAKPEYYQIGTVDGRWRDKLILGPAATTTAITGSATLAGVAVAFEEYGSALWVATTNNVYKWNGTIWVVESEDFGTNIITDLKAFGGVLWIAVSNSSGTAINYRVTNGTTYYTASLTNSKARYFSVMGNYLFKALRPNEVKYSTTADKDLTPPAPTTVLAAGSGIDAGSHSYKIVFIPTANQGVVSAAAAAITHDGSNGRTTVTLPLHPTLSTCTRGLFRNKVADQTTWYLVTTVSDNTTVSYTDSTADAALGTAIADTYSALTDPWSAAATVGDTEININSLTTFHALVYAGKDEGLYSINTSGTVTLVLGDFRNSRSSKNFNKVVVWRDKLFFNIGVGGVFWYDGTNFDYIGWDMLAPDVGLFAEVSGFSPGHDFLYVVIKPAAAGGSATICTLREEDIDGTVDWRWHSIAQLALMDTPTCAYITPLYPSSLANNPKLWIGGNDANSSPDVNKPQYLILPAIGGSPSEDTNYVMPTSIQYFYTPNYDMGFRADRKIFLAIDVISSHPSGATTTINVAYDIDNAGSWTAVVSDGITAGPVTRKAIGASGSVGRYIRYRLGLTTNTASKTPIVHGIVTRAVLRAQKRKVYDYAVRVGDNVILRNGVREKIDSITLATQLKNADDPATQTGVITLTDIDATTHTVVFENMREKEIIDEANRKRERIFYIRAIEVSVS